MFYNWCTCEFKNFNIKLKNSLAFLPHSHSGLSGYCFHPLRTDGQAGGQAGGRWEKVCPSCISETVRCKKLILGMDIG